MANQLKKRVTQFAIGVVAAGGGFLAIQGCARESADTATDEELGQAQLAAVGPATATTAMGAPETPPAPPVIPPALPLTNAAMGSVEIFPCNGAGQATVTAAATTPDVNGDQIATSTVLNALTMAVGRSFVSAAQFPGDPHATGALAFGQCAFTKQSGTGLQIASTLGNANTRQVAGKSGDGGPSMLSTDMQAYIDPVSIGSPALNAHNITGGFLNYGYPLATQQTNALYLVRGPNAWQNLGQSNHANLRDITGAALKQNNYVVHLQVKDAFNSVFDGVYRPNYNNTLRVLVQNAGMPVNAWRQVTSNTLFAGAGGGTEAPSGI